MSLYDDIAALLDAYQTAVLSVVGQDGYPLSLRCKPLVNSAGYLEIRLPTNLPLCDGEASLLCHFHNDVLFDLRSVSIEGRLTQAGDVWHFHAAKVTQGLGRGKFREIVQDVILKPRRSAKAYLQKAGLPRPRVPWDRLKALAKESEADV